MLGANLQLKCPKKLSEKMDFQVKILLS